MIIQFMSAQKNKIKILLILNFVAQVMILLYLYVYSSQVRSHLVELNREILNPRPDVKDLVDLIYTFSIKSISVLPVAFIVSCVVLFLGLKMKIPPRDI